VANATPWVRLLEANDQPSIECASDTLEGFDAGLVLATLDPRNR
jgi:hypothetical protein